MEQSISTSPFHLSSPSRIENRPPTPYTRRKHGTKGKKKRQRHLPAALLCAGVMVAGIVSAVTYMRESSSEATVETARLLSDNAANTNTTMCHTALFGEIAAGDIQIGALIVAGLLIAFTFIGLAIVCDEFFQPALEAISEALHLTPDVAGATFLAAGSSAPELFTSLADAFGDASSIGMGTIVGSAMFNILVIVALSAAVAGKSGASLAIDYRPVARDVCFYTYSILLLAIFFDDGEITVIEAAVMWLSYFGYIGFMFINEKVLSKCKAPNGGDDYKVSPEDESAVAQAAKALEGNTDVGGGSTEDGGKGGGDDKNDDEEEDESRFSLPDSPSGYPLFILSLPLLALMTVTIPDCNTKKWEKWYVLSFFMSIMWIGVLCHFMVEFAVEIACIIEVDAIIMGVLVLAVGTSVPDAIGSMIAARNGEADMAIANAIGSNVFDVLLGLGFPWFLAILANGENFVVCAGGITTAVIILFCTVILFVGVLAGAGWKMNTNIGVALFFLYLCYIGFTVYQATQPSKC